MRKHSICGSNGEHQHHEERVRALSPDGWRQHLERAGFVIEAHYSDYALAPWRENAPAQYNHRSKKSMWLAGFILLLIAMLGAGAYDVLVHSGAPWSENVPVWSGGLLIGILLHISTTILFEASDGHHFNRNKLLVTIAGLVLAVLTTGI